MIWTGFGNRRVTVNTMFANNRNSRVIGEM